MNLQETLKTGNYSKIVICSTANKSYDKTVLQFRVYLNEDTLILATKYKVLKYITKEQKSVLEKYEDFKNNIFNAGFNKKLEWNIKYTKAKNSNTLTKELIEEQIILDSLKNHTYLELI